MDVKTLLFIIIRVLTKEGVKQGQHRSTNNLSLLAAFPFLYNELKNVNVEKNICYQVFHFVNSEIFKASLPEEALLESIED